MVIVCSPFGPNVSTAATSQAEQTGTDVFDALPSIPVLDYAREGGWT